MILGQQPDLLLNHGLTKTPWEEVDRLGIPQIVVSGQCNNLAQDGPKLTDVLVLSYQGSADTAMQQVKQITGSERLTALREGHVIPLEGQAIIGGTQAIEGLDGLANKLAGFK